MFSAIIVAGGASSRMNGTDKQTAAIGGVPVFVMSALKFQQCDSVGEIIIVSPEGKQELFAELAKKHGISKLKAVVCGGATRFLSVKNALSEVSPDIGFIAIHDGARPLISPEDIERVLSDAAEYGAAIAAAPAADTVKISGGGFVEDTPERRLLYYAQTPQAFRKSDYLNWVSRLGERAEALTDDSRLAELCGAKVRVTEITRCNMKITRPEDLAAARAVAAFTEENTMRIGQGYDVHKLCEGRQLVLCGAEIPSPVGLLGHSDADVAVHALMDAVLGALALGDIGKLFPDNDMKYKDADSMKLLEEVVSLMKKSGYTLGNLDITIIAERPKLAGYIPAMRENLAAAFGCGVGQVSVKATTEEGLGLAGEGIGAHASVLLIKG